MTDDELDALLHPLGMAAYSTLVGPADMRRLARTILAAQPDHTALLRQALEALTCAAGHDECESLERCTITAIRSALDSSTTKDDPWLMNTK